MACLLGQPEGIRWVLHSHKLLVESSPCIKGTCVIPDQWDGPVGRAWLDLAKRLGILGRGFCGATHVVVHVVDPTMRLSIAGGLLCDLQRHGLVSATTYIQLPLDKPHYFCLRFADSPPTAEKPGVVNPPKLI